MGVSIGCCQGQSYIDKSDYLGAERLSTEPTKYEPSSDELMEFLDQYHFDKGSASEFPIDYFRFTKKNASLKVKQKLLSLLKNEWTFHDLKRRWLYVKSIQMVNGQGLGTYLKKEATKQAEKQHHQLYFENKGVKPDWALSSIFFHDFYRRAYDSISKPYIKQYMDDPVAKWEIDDWLVKTVAWLNYKEAIPILKAGLAKSECNFNKQVAKVALIKLGDVTYKNEIFEMKDFLETKIWFNNIFSVANPLFFICTQESIYSINNLMDTTKRYPLTAHALQSKGYSSGLIMRDLIGIIKNEDFKKIFESLHMSLIEDYITADIVVKVKNWLINNKGKYIIDKTQFFKNYSLMF